MLYIMAFETPLFTVYLFSSSTIQPKATPYRNDFDNFLINNCQNLTSLWNAIQ